MTIASLLLCILLAPQSQSVTVEAVADTTLSENGPAMKMGASPTNSADGDDPPGSGNQLVSLIKWDLSAIPQGSVVLSAKMELQVTNASAEGFELYRMSRDWNELQATWTEADAGAPWELPGASGASDHGFTVRGIVDASAIGAVTVTLGAEGITAVQAWVDGPSVNYGFILCDASNADGLAFASRETATAGQRPKLTVTFMASSGTGVAPSGGSGFCGATGMEAALLAAFVALARRLSKKK